MFADCLSRARRFILLNGRDLDRALFRFLFEKGPSAHVHEALKTYMNPDGGYGKALEPDIRCPESYPAAVETAFTILELTGGLADFKVQADLVYPACFYLETITTPEGGVPLSLPVVNKYSHAIWWESEDNPPASLNPTASLLGRMRWYGVSHTWMQPADTYCRQASTALESDEFHTLMPVITYLESQLNQPWADEQLARLAERIRRPCVVELDPQAEGYVKMPLDWAPTPDSFCRPLFDDALINLHLTALTARQQDDGGWPISWTALSAEAEAEWRSWVTIFSLRTLRAYERYGYIVP